MVSWVDKHSLASAKTFHSVCRGGRRNDLSSFSFLRRGKRLRNEEPFSEVMQLFRSQTELNPCPFGSEFPMFLLSKHHAPALLSSLHPSNRKALTCCWDGPALLSLQEDASCPPPPGSLLRSRVPAPSTHPLISWLETQNSHPVWSLSSWMSFLPSVHLFKKIYTEHLEEGRLRLGRESNCARRHRKPD